MQDIFSGVSQGVAIVITFSSEHCGWNYFHSFHVIQMKVGTYDNPEVQMCKAHVFCLFVCLVWVCRTRCCHVNSILLHNP